MGSLMRCKVLESMKNSSHSTSRNSQSSKKQPRKCDNPVRLSITECSDHARILYCENSACKAILSSEDGLVENALVPFAIFMMTTWIPPNDWFAQLSLEMDICVECLVTLSALFSRKEQV
ncbi:hypothetical protein KSP39_PZI005969 [Platanthera zijinensis]|uniref:Uncharacterized protein n=1 Tax=Platanthera zijinensis TaxID=2320716 RepID=A0AAP0BUD1_9ASPA